MKGKALVFALMMLIATVVFACDGSTTAMKQSGVGDQSGDGTDPAKGHASADTYKNCNSDADCDSGLKCTTMCEPMIDSAGNVTISKNCINVCLTPQTDPNMCKDPADPKCGKVPGEPPKECNVDGDCDAGYTCVTTCIPGKDSAGNLTDPECFSHCTPPPPPCGKVCSPDGSECKDTCGT